MKYILLYLLLTLITIGCSSNANKGEDAAAAFCDLLKKTNDQEIISGLEELRSKYSKYDSEPHFKDSFESNTSCLSSFTKTIPASNIKQTLKGAFSYNLQVVPQDCKIYWNGEQSVSSNLRIKFKLKYVNTIYSTYDGIEGALTLLDKNNYPIDKYAISRNSAIEQLVKSNVNGEEWIDVNLDRVGALLGEGTIATAQRAIQNAIKAHSFEIFLEGKSYSQSSNSSSSSSTPSEDVTVTNDNSSSSCEEALTEYEQFVDEYIQFAEKAADGDYSAMADAPSLMQKAESAGRKIQSMGQAQLGSTCWDKYIAVQSKLSSAALKITKNMPKNMDNVQKQMDDLKNLMPK